MKAIILAAGYATRLHPLTENQPKPLLTVGEKLIVEHIIDKINQVEEVNEILIVTNNKFTPHFESWLSNYKTQKPIKIINDGTLTNEDRLGAVGDINFVIKKENINDELLIVAGDNLFEFSLKNFVQYYKEKNTPVLAFYNLKEKSKLANKFGVGILDQNQKLVDFEEKPAKPKSTLAATVVYALKKEDVAKISEYIDVSERWDNPGDFMIWLSKQTDVHGFTFTEKWFDIGSFEALEEAYNIYGKG
ncbi:MAG: nucleotidyltransferase family protein [Nanoarchaeota archaeon]|nr:nucleotidyltransferase family protein [Nanoarchaeota archaeon]